MTFIAGVIYQNKVSLYADSAETVTAPLGSASSGLFSELKRMRIEKFSTFREKIVVEDHHAIYEGAQKLYVISESVVITFSGSADLGFEAVEALRFNLLAKKETTMKIISQFFESRRFDENRFLVGFYEREVAHIYYYYNPNDHKIISGTAVISYEGPGTTNATFAAIAEVCFKQETSHEALLIRLLSVLQSVSLNELSIQYGVGGYFNGLLMNGKHIEWVPDTAFLLYSAKHYNRSPTYWAFRFNRDNAAFVASPEVRGLFLSEMDESNRDYLTQKWGTEVNDLINQHKVRYHVILAYDQSNVVIIDENERVHVPTITYEKDYKAICLNKWILDAMFYDALRKTEVNEMHVFANVQVRSDGERNFAKRL